jgi:histidinol-phosphate aminotransferase
MIEKTIDDVLALLRPNIRSLQPYRCARDDYDRGILLDANENSAGDPFGNKEGLNRYPSPYQIPIKNKIAELRGVRPEQIFTGVGSDEAIDLIIRMFCVPSRHNIVITPPTYGMYKVSAQINDVQVLQAPLTPDFELIPERVLEAANAETRVVFLCSPNNPTANLLSRDAIEKILLHFDGIVVVDEAYIDFAPNQSWLKNLNRFPNLVVLQTLSKAFGLAGVRLGLAFAHAGIIGFMNKVKAPYNINQLTSETVLKALDKTDVVARNLEMLISERNRVIQAMSEMPAVEKIYPSDANFVLFKVKDAYRFYKETADGGVVARYRGDQLHCENGVRLTIGTHEENNAFLEKLRLWNPL